jgi:catechol 2,3-dioxygenase-like lactoylglutathione lyase family enzyme
MMKNKSWLNACALIIAAAPIGADGLVSTMAYDNVHIRVSDPAKAGEWYVKHVGATASETPGRVFIGKTLIRFSATDGNSLFPPDTPTGSIDHIGLSFADLSAKINELEGAGAKVTTPPKASPGLFTFGFIEDPWGTRIEVLQDPELAGFHHVHLSVRDPKTTLDWYQEMMGGERAKLRGRIDGLRYGNIWLLAASRGADTAAPATGGLVWNQLAWQVSDITKAFADLQSKGVKPIMELRFRKIEGRDVGTALVKDPNGIRIELLQRSPQ